MCKNLFFIEPFFLHLKKSKQKRPTLQKTGIKTQVFKRPGAEVLLLNDLFLSSNLVYQSFLIWEICTKNLVVKAQKL